MPEIPEKTCSKCQQVKPLGEFYLQSTNPNHRAFGRPQGRCKQCVKAQTGTYQKLNRGRASELQRNWRLENQYGITADDFERMLTGQDGRCAICRREPAGRWGTLAVDHCHKTGRVRGLLCSHCNRGLGYLGDQSAAIARAVAYLEGGPQ